MAKRISASKSPEIQKTMVFGKENYVLLAIGVISIVVGFSIMYLENEIDGFISLYVSPLLIVGGFAEIVYAIMKKPAATSSDNV
jgi:uncharacterized membrane protein HdeD (DUF308 family)